MSEVRHAGHLLLVEDHAELSLWLGKALRRRGFDIEFAFDGVQADTKLRETHWDVVILDLALPGLDGIEVLRNLRERGDATPVLVLTARGDVADRVRGLNLGADDYLPKPFELPELEARLAALMRRPQHFRSHRTTLGDLTLDHDQGAFYRGDSPLALTKREMVLLRVLFERAGRAVSKDYLHEAVFGETEATLDVVEVNIYRLRKKLEHCGISIVTVRGLGYMLERCDA